MQLDFKFFGSRVARRTFVSFLLASLIPIALTAGGVLWQVGNASRERARQELQQASRNAGQLLLDRLILAEEMLQALPRGMAPAQPAALDAAVVRDGGTSRSLFGSLEAADVPDPPPGGKAVLRVRRRADGDSDVLLAIRSAGQVLVGRVDPAYLWRTATLLPYGFELCVFRGNLEVALFCSRALSADAETPLSRSISHGPAGDVTWGDGDGRTMSHHWELFIPSRFDGEPWTVVVSEPSRIALQSLAAFNNAFWAAFGLSLIFIALLSVTQIRRVLGPIERLVEGTKRIAERQFSTRVGTGSDDEFGVLGKAMDTMAEQLGRQFDTLTALGEIDRLILSVADIEQVLDKIMDWIRVIVPDSEIQILLIDADEHSRGRLYRRARPQERLREISRVEVTETFRDWLETHPEGGVPASSEDADTPASAQWAVPILQASRLRGALIVRSDEHVRPDVSACGSLRELSARLAVAITAAERERALFDQAHFDVLTGLPNRQLCYDRLRQALAQARRENHQLAVLFIDLDGFKNINDSLGHTLGDTLLREAAQRLSSGLRDGDTVARLGGDEYVVILPHIGGALEVESIAEKISDALRRPFVIEGRETSVTASVGMTLYPDDGETVEELLRKADTAMYGAKDAGRARCVFFAEEMDQRVKERLSLQVDLGNALRNGELFLAYQPQLNIADGKVVCAEALLRWQHPRRGLVPPSLFVPVLEETGLIESVGQWVMRTAIRDFIGWRRAGLDIRRVAVNVASRQMFASDFLDFVETCLEEHGLEGAALELELTEGSFVADFARANSILGQLRAAGVRVAIDDFGTGYSSLGYLKDLTCDVLKIDRAFVNEIPDPKSVAIIEAVVAVARSLGKEVVAEGIETAQQLDTLERLGCHLGQGYLLGRPCAATELSAWTPLSAAAGRGNGAPDDASAGQRTRAVAAGSADA